MEKHIITLVLCQKFSGMNEDAYKNLYQATWSYAYHSAAYYQLAQIDCQKGNWDIALGTSGPFDINKFKQYKSI